MAYYPRIEPPTSLSIQEFTAPGNTLPGGFSFPGSSALEDGDAEEDLVLGRNTMKLRAQARKPSRLTSLSAHVRAAWVSHTATARAEGCDALSAGALYAMVEEAIVSMVPLGASRLICETIREGETDFKREGRRMIQGRRFFRDTPRLHPSALPLLHT